jgi:beta-glucosidase/6-phospho-beta-glucosidase/beta-galactosidase
MTKAKERPPLPTFPSFFMGGFECTYALTKGNGRLDLLKQTRHDKYCRSDYQLLKDLGITTVREGLSWHQVDQGGGVYDFARFEPMMQIAKEEGIKQIWDLNHFDYPERLDPFAQEFVDCYAEYAKRCIDVIQNYQTGTIYIVPFNEISFWGYIADTGVWAPFRKRSGFALKTQLVKAAINAMEAIWSVNKNVRFIQVDPIGDEACN